MNTRRSFLGACGAALAAGVAGCADAIPTTFEASPARVPDETLTETGYRELDTFAETITPADFGVALDLDALPIDADDIEVTNEVAVYGKDVSVGDVEQTGAFAGVVSTPRMVIEGQAFNPVGSLDPGDLINEVLPQLEAQNEVETVRNVSEVGEQTATILGAEGTVTQFEAEADLQQFDEQVDLVLHVSEALTAGEDFVLVAGGYPDQLADAEEPSLFDLFADVEHGA